ncbi:MAG: MFS transporter [Pseudomonadota bacterium]
MTKADDLHLSIERALTRRVTLIVTVAISLAAVASLFVTLLVFGEGVRPQLMAKASAAGDVIRRDIDTALELGIPFAQLRGLDELAAQTASDMPEIGEITFLSTALTADTAAVPSGLRAVVQSLMPSAENNLANRLVQPIIWQGDVHGTLVITLDHRHLVGQMRDIFFDALIILIVTILVAVELTAFLTQRTLLGPLGLAQSALSARAAGRFALYQRAKGVRVITWLIDALNKANAAMGRRAAVYLARPGVADFIKTRDLQKTHVPSRAGIIDARIPLFVFCFAEELQKSFLPLFVAELHQPTDLFAVDIMMGLPISIFMLVIAVLTPFAGTLVDRHGNRRLFLVGLAPAIAGYGICAMAQSGNDIVLGRGITAIGYAIITISCQSYIAKAVTAENRARGMAVFVGVLMTATLCGTAIGAILADWLDYKPVFVIAAVLAAFAGLLGYMMLAPGTERFQASAPQTQGSARLLLRNYRFLALLLFCAIPTKIVLTGILYLFVPVYLAGLDASQSEIGRIMMLYALVIIPISPLAAGFADRIGQNVKVAAFASLASGLVLLSLLTDPGVVYVIAIVLGLGVAHAFLKAPVIVAVMEVADSIPNVSVTAALGVLRTCERVGSFVGPILVAVLMVHFSNAFVAAIVGIGVSISALVLLVLMRFSRTGQPESV